jgi:hypothetical protein
MISVVCALYCTVSGTWYPVADHDHRGELQEDTVSLNFDIIL